MGGASIQHKGQRTGPLTHVAGAARIRRAKASVQGFVEESAGGPTSEVCAGVACGRGQGVRRGRVRGQAGVQVCQRGGAAVEQAVRGSQLELQARGFVVVGVVGGGGGGGKGGKGVVVARMLLEPEADAQQGVGVRRRAPAQVVRAVA